MRATCRLNPVRVIAALVMLVVLTGPAGNAWGVAYHILDLGTLGGAWSEAYGIDDSGRVVGWAETASGLPHAFRTAPNQPINFAADDLGTGGGDYSLAKGINDRGQVVGSVGRAEWVEDELNPGQWYYEYWPEHAFRTAPHRPIDPATDYLGATVWQAFGINSSGQVAGCAGTASGAMHAFRTAPNQPINPATDDLGTL